MFCFQCEQTANHSGCTARGVCGKTHDTASLQDLLIQELKETARYAFRTYNLTKYIDEETVRFILQSLFMTVTNVNFDQECIAEQIRDAIGYKTKARLAYADACTASGHQPEKFDSPIRSNPVRDVDSLVRTGEALCIADSVKASDNDAFRLQQLVLFGLKGCAAYADHAAILGKTDEELDVFFLEMLSALAEKPQNVNSVFAMAMKTGEMNLKIMGMLNSAHVGRFGNPEPTRARISHVKGKAILVSGHDLLDLDMLLRQTEGRGINVYTHGEMLPALAYPELKKYSHLIGNYGSAWQLQNKEFDEFPGSILMTTNCIQAPRPTYANRIFCTGNVSWPGVRSLLDKNFSELIDAAFAEKGFADDEPERFINIGYAVNSVMEIRDKLIESFKKGHIRHIFIIGGCDGAKPGRDYYTKFAQLVPQDCLIITLACGKYRFNKLEFGDIDGIPRLLDCGQCNDAYSAIMIAAELAEIFKCTVNELPLSFILSWYEQKAVCVLLTLLYLGVKNIRIGPTFPACLSPALIKMLSEKYNIMPIRTPEADIEEIFKK